MENKYYKNKMNFLIIGSNSFSGSHFIDYLLKKKHRTFGVSRSKEINSIFLPYKKNTNKKLFKFYKCNLNSSRGIKLIINLIKKKKINYIVNFAAQAMVAESWKFPIDYYNTNILSQAKLHLKLLNIKNIKKFVQVSTPEVYGDNKGIINENSNYNPSTPYAVSRAACDLHLMNLFKNYRFPVVFTRAANVYGPGQQIYRIVPKTIMSSLGNKNMFLHGGGISQRSFIYITDVAEATYNICLKGDCGEIYHISGNHVIKIKNLVRKIFKLTKNIYSKFVRISKDRPGKDQLYYLNNMKLIKKFKCKPKINLDQGLYNTISWIKENYKYLSSISDIYKYKK